MKRFWSGFLLILIILGIFLFYYRREQERHKDTITLFGNIDVRQVDLGFLVTGRIERMYFEEGQQVTAGTLLAELETSPYDDQVKQAQAALDSTKISLANAEKNYKRRIELVQNGSVSKEDLDNSLTSYETLMASEKQLEASLSIAKTNLEEVQLFAPTDGTILTRIREPGAIVKESDPIYTLSILSPVWVRAFVSEPFLGVVYPGMAAEVHTDTKNGKVYKGYIGFISPVAEFTPKSVETTELRTDLVYRLRVIVDNPDFGLRQGMPVTVVLKVDHEPSRH